MSYTIEYKPRVYLTPPLPFQGMTRPFRVALFVADWGCNNVYPRSQSPSLIAVDSSVDDQGIHRWNGEVMLPSELWTCAQSADGGSIKPAGRDTTGAAYLAKWKKLATQPIPITGARLRLSWWPGCYRDGETAWKMTEEQLLAAHATSTLWRPDYYGQRQRAAWEALVPEADRTRPHRGEVSIGLEQLPTTLDLWKAERTPMDFCLTPTSFTEAKAEAPPAPELPVPQSAAPADLLGHLLSSLQQP